MSQQSPLNFDNFNAIRGQHRKPHGWFHTFVVGTLVGLAVQYVVRKNWHRGWVRLAYCLSAAALMALLPAILLVALIGLVWVEARPGYDGAAVPVSAFVPGGLLYLRLTYKWTRGLLGNNGRLTRPRP